MATIWFIGDTHFHHRKAWETFKRPDGTPLRPFVSTEEMNETMVRKWNDCVRPKDKVYHLGDVALISRKEPDAGLNILTRLNGQKRLVGGNHDEGLIKFAAYFEEIYAVRVFNDFIASHIPLRPEQIGERWGFNAHGHLHDKTIKSARYVNVSVEQTNYAPITIDEVRARAKKNRECYGPGS